MDRIALYAKDVLLYVLQLRQFIQFLMQMLRVYCKTSSIKVNWGKSTLVPLRSEVETGS